MSITALAYRSLVIAAMSLCLCGACFAYLVIGQVAGFTGPAAAADKEHTEGARLRIDHVNALGGVHGQRIMLVSMDDKFDPGFPRKARANSLSKRLCLRCS